MYRTPIIIGKISPDRANRTQTRRGVCCTLKGLIFDKDLRSTHYPAYCMATCQNEKITTHSVSFYNSKTLTSLVVKLTTCGVKRRT